MAGVGVYGGGCAPRIDLSLICALVGLGGLPRAAACHCDHQGQADLVHGTSLETRVLSAGAPALSAWTRAHSASARRDDAARRDRTRAGVAVGRSGCELPLSGRRAGAR